MVRSAFFLYKLRHPGALGFGIYAMGEEIILMVTAQDIKEKLQTSFGEEAHIVISDLTGGGDHWRVQITSPLFQGQSLVEQHQMVYRALGDWMKQDIHALALQTSAS
jgi:stress-induced morphogen